MFLLIPIGHEEDSVRRLPWVTIAVVAACVLVHLWNIGTPASVMVDIQSTQQEILAYWLERPYLDLPPELQRESQRWRFEHEWTTEGGREDEPSREPSSSRKAQEQQELDRLVASWRIAWEQVPHNRYGLVPASFEIGDLFAYMFLHAGWMHLIGNLIFLWLTGPPLEDVWGRPYFAAFYIATGVFGGIAWAAIYPSSATPLIGASGAVAGLMGAFMVRYGKTPVKMFYFLFWFFPFILRTGTFNAPAALMLGLWFGRELFSAIFLGSYSGVAFAVHVAGFAFGAGAALLARRYRFEHKIAPQLDKALGGDNLSNPALEDAHNLRQKGRHERAWEMLITEVQRRPDNYETNLALWDVGMELGRQREAAPYFLRSIRSELRDGELETGVYHWYELVDQVPDLAIDLELRIRLAEAMLSTQHEEAAADLLADADRLLAPSAPLGARVRLARVAAFSRSASAPALCEPLLHHPAVPEKRRQELQKAWSAIEAFGLRPKPEAPTPAVPEPAAHSPAPAAQPTGMLQPPVAPPAPAPQTDAAAQSVAAAQSDATAPSGGMVQPPAAAAPPPPTPPQDDNAPLPLADDSPQNRVLKVMAGVPRRLTGDKLAIDVHGQGARTLPLSRVQAVAVGRIEEGFASNYVLIDLLVDSLWTNRPTVRTVRLQSTDFDPTEVLPALDGGDPLQALISFIDNLIEISGANPMPDPDGARGRPFHNFVSVPDYEANVIGFTSQ